MSGYGRPTLTPLRTTVLTGHGARGTPGGQRGHARSIPQYSPNAAPKQPLVDAYPIRGYGEKEPLTCANVSMLIRCDDFSGCTTTSDPAWAEARMLGA